MVHHPIILPTPPEINGGNCNCAGLNAAKLPPASLAKSRIIGPAQSPKFHPGKIGLTGPNRTINTSGERRNPRRVVPALYGNEPPASHKTAAIRLNSICLEAVQ
jgi:hypothetical protein